jgi:hypothetical protein
MLKMGGTTRDMQTANLSMDSNEIELKMWSIVNSKLNGTMAPIMAMFKNFNIAEFASVSSTSLMFKFK